MAKMGAISFCLFVALALVYMAAETKAASCRTSGSSPTVGDARTAVQTIRNLGSGTSCCQQVCSGDFCTTMSSSGGARTRICGNCNSCVSCSTAGNALANVLNQCVQNGRVSGSDFDSGFEFQVAPTGSGLEMPVE